VYHVTLCGGLQAVLAPVSETSMCQHIRQKLLLDPRWKLRKASTGPALWQTLWPLNSGLLHYPRRQTMIVTFIYMSHLRKIPAYLSKFVSGPHQISFYGSLDMKHAYNLLSSASRTMNFTFAGISVRIRVF
jgi:hypothetical protein